MTAETAPAPAKPTKATAKSSVAMLDAEPSLHVRNLLFRGHCPLPMGLDEQQVLTLSEDRSATKAHYYRISFLPRIDKFLVRVFDVRNEKQVRTFQVPGDWAVAEFAEP